MSQKVYQRTGVTLLRCLAITVLILWVIECALLLRMPGKPFAGFRYEATLDVSTINDPSWNGPQARIKHAPVSWKGQDLYLQQYDRIVSVNGSVVRSAGELRRLVEHQRVGATLSYQMLRGSQSFSVPIATQLMSWSSWFRSFMSLMLPGLCFLLVGMAVFWLKPANPAARAHLLMTASVALFATTNSDIDGPARFIALFPLSLAFLGATFLHLALVFPEPPELVLKRPAWEWAPYLSLLALALPWYWCFKPLGYMANPARFEQHMKFYMGSTAWILLCFLLLIAAFVWKAAAFPQPNGRRQAKIALIGAAIGLLPTIIAWGALLFCNGAELGPLGLLTFWASVFTIAFPTAIVYAILSAELFEIQVIVKRTVTYAIAVAALAGLYVVLAATVRGWADLLFGVHSGTGPWENLVATGFVAVAFSPLVSFTRAKVDWFFDREPFEVGAVLERFNDLTDQTLEPDELVASYFDLAEQTVRPQHMSIFLLDPEAGLLGFRAQRGEDLFKPGYAMTTDGGELLELKRAIASGVLAASARTAPLRGGRSLGFQFYAPLIAQGQVMGRVNFGAKRSDLAYSPHDAQLLVAMAHRLADKLRIAEMVQVAIAKARLDQELATAREIQFAMLPTSVPVLPGLEIAGSSRPAHEFGGDYFDLVPLGRDRLAVAIGDVVGKGVQAALVMAMTKAAFWTRVQTNSDIDYVVSGINRMICDTIPDKVHRKTTFCYAILDRQHVSYACAGHPAPILWRQTDQSCSRLATPGAFPLGVSRNSRYQVQEAELAPGDVLVFFTDGVTEARSRQDRPFYDILTLPDGQLEEQDELAITIASHAGESAAAIRQAILLRLANFIGNGQIEDDVTIVVVKVKPA